MNNLVIMIVAGVLVLVFVIFLFLLFSAVRVWFQGLLCGVPVSILDVIGMRLRRTPPSLIVGAAINLKHRGEAASIVDVEKTYLAFGEGVTSPTELANLVLEHRSKSKS
jgi:uncharacterized protein YqfA (UPF0365 family)